MTALVPLRRVTVAEAVRWRRDPGTWSPLVGLVLGAGLGLLSGGVRTSHGWGGVLAWLNAWAVFAGPMLGVLVVALSVAGDRSSRGGGTWWRPVDRVRSDVAKLVVMSVIVLAMQVMAVVGVVVVGAGRIGPGVPVLRIVELVLALWAGALFATAVALRVARRLGVLGALAAGVVWCVAGVLAAESRASVVVPPAWGVRATIPLLGTHANGVALEHGSALHLIAPVPWALAALAGAVLVTVVRTPAARVRGVATIPDSAVGAPPRSRSGGTDRFVVARPERGPRAVGRGSAPRSAPGALLRSFRRTPLWVVPLVAVALCLLMTRWQPADRILVLVPVLVVPLVAVVTPTITWGRQRPAWRAIATRSVSPARLGVVLATITAAVAVGSVLAPLAVVGVLAGADPVRLAALGVLSVLAAVMVTTWQLVLGMAAGRAVALAVGIIGVFVSVLVGGSGLGAVFWLVDPWSWGAFGAAAQRVVTVPVMFVAIALGVLAVARCSRRVSS